MVHKCLYRYELLLILIHIDSEGKQWIGGIPHQPKSLASHKMAIYNFWSEGILEWQKLQDMDDIEEWFKTTNYTILIKKPIQYV